MAMRLENPDQLSHLQHLDDIEVLGVPDAISESLSYPDQGNEACNQVEDASYWFTHRNNCISKLVKDLLPKGIMLDVGGGNGLTARALNDAGVDCWLVEPGRSGCCNARVRNVPTVIMATLEQLELPNNAVAGVGLFDVIEHLEHVQPLLREVYRVVQPGGLIAVTVPALTWLWSSEDDYAGHFRRYTKKSLQRSVCDAGFEAYLSEYLFGPLVLPLLLCRSIPSRIGLRRGGDWKRASREHGLNRGFLTSAVTRMLEREFRHLCRNRWPYLGTSCVIMARKPGSRVDHG